MTERLHYGATAKSLHWLVVVLLINQYVIGWRMPDIEPGTTPGDEMTWHVSFGLFILAVIILRLIWRLTHPVAPESSLAAWQRLGSEAAHWLLYLLVLATTVLGWFFASARGWTISWFFTIALPMLTAQGSSLGRLIGRYHHNLAFALLVLITIHVAAAFLHLVWYRDRVMQRMLPAPSKRA